MKFGQYWLARMGGYMEQQNGDGGVATTASHGAGAEFAPDTNVQQGEGLFDQRAQAEAQQQAQDDIDNDVETDTNTDTGATDEVTTEEGGSNSGSDSDTTTNDDVPVYQYGGVEVEIENKPEMVEAFKEKGLDIDAVNKEIYSADGLTDETKQKLYDAFGQVSVDMYLEGLEKQNQAFVETSNAATEKFNNQVESIITEVAGDKIDSVFKWANDNLKPEEYKEYQDRINGDDLFVMKLALQDLTKRAGVGGAELQQPVVKESVRETALTASTSSRAAGEVEMLSEAEYKNLFVPDPNNHGKAPYWADPAKYDAMRNAGRAAGI